MTFLESINRVLRTTGIIKGDDDNILTFADVQHNATLNLAQISIQSELSALVASQLIPYERNTNTITTVAGQRTYALDATFVRFFGTPFLYDAANNNILYSYDENVLRQQIPTYKTQPGTPFYWYFVGGATKQIAFYPVPDDVKSYDYEFEKNVQVTNAGDILPFQSEQEAQVFCNLAARHFLILFQEQPDKTLLQDSIYMTQKSILFTLMTGANQRRYYGVSYS